jgi:hypothetical protein
LLTDDGRAVETWVSALVVWVTERSGIGERDLAEDAAVAYIYLLVSAVLVALLLQLPIPAVVAGLLGIGAHGPAKVAARLSRSAYRALDPGD